MKKLLLSTITAAALAVGTNAFAQVIASDNGGNYGGGWSSGTNGGFGFTAWNISATPGTGFAGAFIGDPSFAGVTGMSTTSFGMYANPGGSGATVTVSRGLSNALSVGDTFSFQWGINWDSDVGNKGFNIFSGCTGGTQLVNVNQAGFPGDITMNGTNTSIAFGTGPMTWSFTLQSATSLLVTSSARDGTTTPVYSTNLTISAAPDAVSFYATAMGAGDQRQSYFNNLSVVPEPSTYALLALSAAGLAGYAARRRARK
ncbi:MAG: PEP-CTERM sorting domain-containing protein [Chthoniobacterales bacterium]